MSDIDSLLSCTKELLRHFWGMTVIGGRGGSLIRINFAWKRATLDSYLSYAFDSAELCAILNDTTIRLADRSNGAASIAFGVLQVHSVSSLILMSDSDKLPSESMLGDPCTLLHCGGPPRGVSWKGKDRTDIWRMSLISLAASMYPSSATQLMSAFVSVI